MNYFDLVPSELNNIVISYLTPDSLEKLLSVFEIPNLNWSTINEYRFGIFKNVIYTEYLNNISKLFILLSAEAPTFVVGIFSSYDEALEFFLQTLRQQLNFAKSVTLIRDDQQ